VARLYSQVHLSDLFLQRRLATVMNVCIRRLRSLISDAEGATAVEYAVMLAMILIVLIAGVGAVGGQSGGMWGSIQNGLKAVGFGGS